MIKKFSFFIVLIFILNGCGKNDVWTGYVYPSVNDLANYRYVGSFSSLEDCRTQCQYLIRENNYRNGDYECGLNCKNKDGINVCEKTSR